MIERPATIPAALARAATRWPDKDAYVTGDRRVSYTELHEQVLHTSAALIESGIHKGDRVAVLAPNTIEWAVAALALRSAGAWLIPVSTRYKKDEAESILSRSHAKLIFTTASFLGNDYIKMLRECNLPDLREVVTLDDSVADGTTAWSVFNGRADARAIDRAVETAAGIAPGDVSDVLFTSGTTGIPKGAMLTHGGNVGNMEIWSDCIGFGHHDRSLGVNPFFHIFGLNAGILANVLRGATLFPQLTFDVDAVLALITDERLSFLPGPPTVFQMLIDHPQRDVSDISSLDVALIGSSTIPPALIHQVRDDLGFNRVVSAYGLTEATGLCTISRREDPFEVVAETSGSPLPGLTFRVVDDAGAELPPGQAGELLVHSPFIMKGYLDDPASTAEAIDAEGYLHTGDIGYFDERNNVHVTDRKKDIFIVGGFNVYSAEVEQKIASYPGVSQVAVVGAPDHRLGSVGMAFVLPLHGAAIDVDDLVSWCREHMANFKVPRSVQIVSSMPVSAAGKVLKYQLREQAMLRTMESS